MTVKGERQEKKADQGHEFALSHLLAHLATFAGLTFLQISSTIEIATSGDMKWDLRRIALSIVAGAIWAGSWFCLRRIHVYGDWVRNRLKPSQVEAFEQFTHPGSFRAGLAVATFLAAVNLWLLWRLPIPNP